MITLPTESPWSELVKHPLVVTHTFRCCVPGCGVIMSMDIPCANVHYEIMRVLPDGWRECWGALVCERHKIHCRVDNGVEFDL